MIGGQVHSVSLSFSGAGKEADSDISVQAYRAGIRYNIDDSFI
jgi:hypothetical protein